MAQCLTNVPTVDASVNLYGLEPGQIWGADDQCKQIYGANSFYLRVRPNQNYKLKIILNIN